MAEQFPGQDPNQAPVPTEGLQEAAPQSRLAGAIDTMKQAAAWSAPVVNEALSHETGNDMYGLVGAEQPELTKSQQFSAGVARFAMQRVGERIAERATNPA